MIAKSRVAVTTIITTVIIALAAAVLAVFAMPSAAMADGLALSATDKPVISVADISYAATESHMLAATVEFTDGNEGGLVFGNRDGKYFVFKANIVANAVELAYFDGEDEHSLAREYLVGPQNMTADEITYVESRTASLKNVYLRVVVKQNNEGAEFELYADGIKRFVFTDGSAPAAKLVADDYAVKGASLSYAGGKFGYYCGANSTVKFADITEGATDYSYYNELYRNQFHLSQYARWNNDPNGMVYYRGYYHVYFQHNPYGETWDTMHWGHARSRDLVNWEMLPIALVPDTGLDDTLGAIWSGSARVYRKGDSDAIDGGEDYDWFDQTGKAVGDELGLIGFYTRHDDGDYGGNRYTVIMYSTDGGLTWNKRNAIHRSVSIGLNGNKLGCDAEGNMIEDPNLRPSWRDPKVFDISAISGISDGYKWGMALTGMEDQSLYFLKSKNLVDWEDAGVYKIECGPECPDVFGLGEHTVVTFSSRYYIVCDLAYENGKIVMKDLSGAKITRLDKSDSRLKKLEYGPDSYAGQTFYIDGASDSAYRNSAVGLSWLSGVPGADESVDSGALAAPRKVWNGGGMTIPVVFGLNGDRVTQTPITKTSSAFASIKTQVSSVTDREFAAGANMLDGFSSGTAEIKATIQNPSKGSVALKVNMRTVGGVDYYTEIGWNGTDGYYVSREHSEDGGIAQNNYARKFVSGVGKNNTTLDFYVIIDRNVAEVFCDDGAVPFYVITFASPYATGVSFIAQNAVTATISASTVGTAYRTSDEIMINLSSTELHLGDELTTSKKIIAYAGGEQMTWSIEQDEAVDGEQPEPIVSIQQTEDGAIITAHSGGNARVKVTAGAMSRIVDVFVHSGAMEGAPEFETAGIVSGEYYYDDDTLVGYQPSGDGFILSRTIVADIETYAVRFDLGEGPAAAIVFRASAAAGRITDGFALTYDRPANLVKLWSLRDGQMYGSASGGDCDVADMTLAVRAVGRRASVALNGKFMFNANLRDDDPTQGALGLNVCKTRAVFKSIFLRTTGDVIEWRRTTENAGNADIEFGIEQEVTSVVNVTMGRTTVPQGFWENNGNSLRLDCKYLSTLPAVGEYEFIVNGALPVSYIIDIKEIPLCDLPEPTIVESNDLCVFVGGRRITIVLVDGEAIPSRLFEVKNFILTVRGEALPYGDRKITLYDDSTGIMNNIGEFTVQVYSLSIKTVNLYMPPRVLDYKAMRIGLTTIFVLMIVAAIALTVVAVLIKRGKIKLPVRTDNRAEVYRRRDIGLIVGGAIILPILAFFIVGLATSPLTVSGCTSWIVMIVITAVFGYPYAVQMFWKGKLYKRTLLPIKSRGTPKEIFAAVKTEKRGAIGYLGATAKTVWLFVMIAIFAVIAMSDAPFAFKSQLRGLIYGEFGFSADGPQNPTEQARPIDNVNSRQDKIEQGGE